MPAVEITDGQPTCARDQNVGDVFLRHSVCIFK